MSSYNSSHVYSMKTHAMATISVIGCLLVTPHCTNLAPVAAAAAAAAWAPSFDRPRRGADSRIVTRPRQTVCWSKDDSTSTSDMSLSETSELTDGSTEKESFEIIEPGPRLPPAPRSSNSPSTDDLMKAMGTSPRRIVLSLASSTSIALAANFLGMTSRLLETVPEATVEATGLDTYFPRGDYKRFNGEGYTFVLPKEWVGDTAVELAKAQRRSQSLDYSIKRTSASGVLPDAAFGPPGRLNSRGVSNVDTNVSVVISKVLDGFSLRGTLGTPTNAAETYLRLTLAPEGSGRLATLVNAQEDTDRGVYQFEYTVDRGTRGPPLRAISVIAERFGNTLLTMTVVSPLDQWSDVAYEAKLRKIANSFHLR